MISKLLLTAFLLHLLLEFTIDNQSLERIQVFFPDPWRKKRHYKRRLLHAPFLHMCYADLKPRGVLWMVSDWQDYAEDIREHMRTLEARGLFALGAHAVPILEQRRAQSRFEQKGRARGHEIYAMVYRKLEAHTET